MTPVLLLISTVGCYIDLPVSTGMAFVFGVASRTSTWPRVVVPALMPRALRLQRTCSSGRCLFASRRSSCMVDGGVRDICPLILFPAAAETRHALANELS